MTDAARITPGYGSAANGTAGHGRRRHAAPAFQQVLARAQWHAHARTAPVIHPAVARVLAPASSGKALPASSDGALTQAMALESVPSSWHAGLSFIMAQESGGQVDARNPVHSARGLYQLTRANWHLNPHGAASFGNAVEEVQGGIRYIRERYGSADQAVAFWQQHHWY